MFWFVVFCGCLGSVVEVGFLVFVCVVFFFILFFPLFFFSSVFVFFHATALLSSILNDVGFQEQRGKRISVVLRAQKRTVSI